MVGKIQKGIIFLLSLCMVTLLSVTVPAAQEPEFRLDADTLNLQKGVSSKIVVSLINAQGAQDIAIEGLENFDVLSQSQSSSTTIINNDSVYQVDIHATIMPKVTGQFTLKGHITYNGQNYETNSLQVTVSEDSANENNSTPDMFIETVVSHEEAFIGEKIVLTYRLYSRDSINEYGFSDYTAIDGLIAKEVSSDQLKSESLYIDGNRYNMYEVKQLIIDPMKPGVYTIPSFNLQVNVITDSDLGGPFSGMFRTTTPKYLQTDEKELIVKQLPTEGKPNNFSGIVGEPILDSNYSRNEVNYGDSLALQISLYGNCNLDGVKNIIGSVLSGFSVYETQKDFVESIENNQYHVQKSLEAILVPEKTGVLDVPPVSISYFNPVTGKYEVLEIPAAEINVLGDMPAQIVNNGDNMNNVEAVYINQVNYTDENGSYYAIQIPKDTAFAILIGVVVLIIITCGFLWLILWRKKKNPLLKSLYRKIVDAKDINEIYNLFNSMIKHCYNVNLKASSRETIRSSLLDSELISKVTDVMDYIESNESLDEKGHKYLKDKIKGIYTANLSRCTISTKNAIVK